MAFSRQQIRDSIERAGEAHWQALIRHHEDAYPESPPTPGDVATAEAERLNALGLGDDPNLTLVASRPVARRCERKGGYSGGSRPSAMKRKPSPRAHS